MPQRLKFAELLDAFQIAGDGIEIHADPETGDLYYQYDHEPSLSDELPHTDRLVVLPDRRALGLGKPLALAFAESLQPGDFDVVRDIFSRRGAYGRFNSFLVSRGAVDAWRTFSAKAEEAALRAWCEDMGLEIDGDGDGGAGEERG